MTEDIVFQTLNFTRCQTTTPVASRVLFHADPSQIWAQTPEDIFLTLMPSECIEFDETFLLVPNFITYGWNRRTFQ